MGCNPWNLCCGLLSWDAVLEHALNRFWPSFAGADANAVVHR